MHFRDYDPFIYLPLASQRHVSVSYTCASFAYSFVTCRAAPKVSTNIFDTMGDRKFDPLSPLDDLTSVDFYIDAFDYENKTGKSASDPVTVTFYTQDNSVYTHTFIANDTVGIMKDTLSRIFHVPLRYIDIVNGTRTVKDRRRLFDFNLGEFMNVDFKLRANVSKFNMRASELQKDKEPDIITVRVQTDDGDIKDVVVEIVDKCISKPFLGGYYHKASGYDYHHAYSQTGPPEPKVPAHMKNHRDTQTYALRNRLLDTKYDRATQMSNTETWIPNVNDRILTARPYETAEEREKKSKDFEGCARVIQRYYWRWKLNKALKELCARCRRRKAALDEAEKEFLKQDEDRKKVEINCKVFPRSKQDFCMLYAMVDRWKKAEINRISATCTKAPKVAAFYMLLEKEIQMLTCIENHRKQIQSDVQVQREIDFFKTIGGPLRWDKVHTVWTGDEIDLRISMDTIETQRGREYKELYLTVRDKKATKEERLEALLNLKLLLKDHNCETTTELVALIDRECELQVRDMKNYHLEVLQKRIQSLLMKHFESTDPRCSQNVPIRYRRVKAKQMADNLVFCKRCRKYKMASEFDIHSRTDNLRVCAGCQLNDRVEQPWLDIAPYRYMLRQIRRDERLKGCQSSIVFILQEKDIHFIVMNIWHGHSVLSEADNLYQLRLCRWYKDEDWAPWNCVLFTYEEAKVHFRIRDLSRVYSPEFLRKITHYHLLAKKHFYVALEHDLRLREKDESGEVKWKNVKVHERCAAVNSKTKIFYSCH